jgi:hypothetical protein
MRSRLACTLILLVLASGCGDDGAPCPSGDPGCQEPAPTLDDVLPPVPPPTGAPQAAWAGQVADAAGLIPGPAQTGRVGDYYLANARARFIVQAPGRVIGVVPYGGNLIDVAPAPAAGQDALPDHFGELSLVYQLGRTCEHTEVEVVQDGAGGGAAVLRARGQTAVNDYVNLRGVGLLDVPPAQDPDTPDGMLCATTYVLHPDSPALEVYFTLLNPGAVAISGPIGTLSDTGGDVHVWQPEHGFQGSVGLEGLLGGAGTPVPHVVHQGPGVAYGIVPRPPDGAGDVPNASFSISGVSMLVFGATRAVDLFDPRTYVLDLPPRTGTTRRVDVIAGKDAADVAAALASPDTAGIAATARVPGAVTWSDGAPAPGARVGFYRDTDGDGALGPGDAIAAYTDAGDTGAFEAVVPPGNYLVRAEVPDTGRSAATAVELTQSNEPLALTLPAPVIIDYTIQGGGEPVPARLTVIGHHPAPPDPRLYPTFDRLPGAVQVVHAMRGTSAGDVPDHDPPLALPVSADGPVKYRVEASRGTEWTAAHQIITVSPGAAIEPLAFELVQAVPTPGYVASEYHVHQLGSPDAVVTNERRVASMLAEGMELFATSDHDFVADLQPLIEKLGATDRVRNIPGIEVTPFAYGHFNAWPLAPDESPNHGAIDWARGPAGLAMIPAEVFAAMRARGADLVQINHPRTNDSRGDFQSFFDRAGLEFDLDARQILADMGPVPNQWLRLPEVSLWSDDFDALEVWNGFVLADSNGDGVRELAGLDVTMRDWFNFLSLGLVVTPLGNSDTHYAFADPAGMPRTYVRVTDDSPLAIESGRVVDDVLDTLSGRSDAMGRDVVVSNGPFLEVTLADTPGSVGSVIGREIAATGGRVALDVRAIAPAWAAFDTIEVFANATPDVPAPGKPLAETALTPHLCYTSRDPATLAENDVCARAVGGAQPLTVTAEDGVRHVATLRVEVDAGAIATRAGASGSDAWLVVRVRGDRAIYPVMLNGITGDAAAVDTLLADDPAAVEALLAGRGVPATAFTAPVFVDFDGGGYRAPFSPE